MRRVLLVEESDTDARTLQTLLHESGVSASRVDAFPKAIDAVRDESVEAVVLDFGKRRNAGLATLRKLREARPAVPVVVLTGTTGEDTAVAAAAAGAQDCLPGGAADGRTLLRAIRCAQERCLTEERLRASEERLRAMVENSFDGIVLLDANGMVRGASASITRILGWELAEFESRDIFGFIHEDDRAEARQVFEAVLRGELRTGVGRRRYLCKDGSVRVIDVTRSNRLHDPAVGAVVMNYRAVPVQPVPAAVPARARAYSKGRTKEKSPMSELIAQTVDELRAGRTGWRVRLLLGVPALLAGMMVGLV